MLRRIWAYLTILPLLLLAFTLFGLARSEGEFHCKECNCPYKSLCHDYRRRNCSVLETDPEDVMWPSVPRKVPCASKVCYVVFANYSSTGGFGVSRKDLYWSMGCSVPLDTDADQEIPLAYPVYAALPPPQTIPGPGQYVCRRNAVKVAGLLESVSCFCFQSGCQDHMKDTYREKMLANLMQQEFPYQLQWMTVDIEGHKISDTPQWKQPRPTGNESLEEFYCGNCPCDWPAAGKCDSRQKCPREDIHMGFLSYAIDRPCSSRQCYLVFGTDSSDRHVWSKGCATMTTQEESDYNQNRGTPTYYAYPKPPQDPGYEGFVCRKNHGDYNGFKMSVSCFCYLSKCQSAWIPLQHMFKNNLWASLPPAADWVYVGLNGWRRPGEPWTTPAPATTPALTSPSSTTPLPTTTTQPPTTTSPIATTTKPSIPSTVTTSTPETTSSSTTTTTQPTTTASPIPTTKKLTSPRLTTTSPPVTKAETTTTAETPTPAPPSSSCTITLAPASSLGPTTFRPATFAPVGPSTEVPEDEGDASRNGALSMYSPCSALVCLLSWLLCRKRRPEEPTVP